MKKIHLKFFASLADRIGLDEEQLDIPPTITNVGELKNLLAERDSNWLSAMTDPSIKCAVNHQLANETFAIEHHAEIAFFPPMTGG